MSQALTISARRAREGDVGDVASTSLPVVSVGRLVTKAIPSRMRELTKAKRAASAFASPPLSLTERSEAHVRRAGLDVAASTSTGSPGTTS